MDNKKIIITTTTIVLLLAIFSQKTISATKNGMLTSRVASKTSITRPKKETILKTVGPIKEPATVTTSADTLNSVNLVKRDFSPYLQVGGLRFFNLEQGKLAGSMDLFWPIWQTSNKLIFADLRFCDRSGGSFEGNVHAGYRYLSPNEQWLIGIYGAFDRRRTGFGNYFNQLTIGGEFWLNKLFYWR